MKFVDVDGHILEPAGLWENNLEPKYRDRAMHFEKDENGLEYWVVDGQPNHFLAKGTSANTSTIGKSKEWRRKNVFENPTLTWEDGRAMNPGGCCPHERVKLMDQEGIDKSILYPTLGLDWPGSAEDPEIAAAYCRVYNDWIVDFCNHHPQRLYPALILPWLDISESLKELKRTVTVAPRAVMTPSAASHNIPYGDAHWDPLWAEFQEQDIPVGLHVAASPGANGIGGILYPDLTTPNWWGFVNTTDTQLSFMSFFQGSVFDRFPKLKLVVLESGTLWVPYLLERMDEKFEIIGFTTEMKKSPSEYFQNQCWLSMDPDDEFGPIVIKLLGADKLVWAYDYPHSDSPLEPVKNLRQTLQDLPEADQRKVMGENVINLYHLN